MRLTEYLSAAMIPIITVIIIGSGVLKKEPVFTLFQKGAKTGLQTAMGMLPTLIGIMTAVGVLRSSGLLERVAQIPEKFLVNLGVPSGIVPILIVRMFSASAATGLTLDLFRQYGPDSRAGLMASVSLSCTETIFYTMGIYFASVKIKKGRYTLKGAILATITGVLASILLVTYL